MGRDLALVLFCCRGDAWAARENVKGQSPYARRPSLYIPKKRAPNVQLGHWGWESAGELSCQNKSLPAGLWRSARKLIRYNIKNYINIYRRKTPDGRDHPLRRHPAIPEPCTHQEVYAHLSLLPRLESGEITSVSQIKLNLADHESLRILLTDELVRRNPAFRPNRVCAASPIVYRSPNVPI